MEIEKKTIAVWFSCGAASAVAAFMVKLLYGDTHNVLLVNNPVIEENVDNIRFKNDVSKWLDIDIISASSVNYKEASAELIWRKRRYMSGVGGAPCTMLLKRQARYEFERLNKIDYHVLGYTFEERHRHDRFIKFERSNVLPVLIDWGITKEDCFFILKQYNIILPLMYRLGFSNANCVGCVKSSSVGYWQLVREKFPEIFLQRSLLSRQLNCKLVEYRGKRVFLDELPPDAVGRKPKSSECGIFCQTRLKL